MGAHMLLIALLGSEIMAIKLQVALGYSFVSLFVACPPISFVCFQQF